MPCVFVATIFSMLSSMARIRPMSALCLDVHGANLVDYRTFAVFKFYRKRNLHSDGMQLYRSGTSLPLVAIVLCMLCRRVSLLSIFA